MAASDRSSEVIGPRELLLHRFGSVAVAALADGATEDDLRSVLAHAVAAFRRRQAATGPRLRLVPGATR